MWQALRRTRGAMVYCMLALMIGAMGPSLVAWFVVFPLKSMPVAAAWIPARMAVALLLNGVWGLGVALLMRLFGGAGAPPPRH